MLSFHSHAPTFVQLHSPDYLVRVTGKALRHIVFDHVCTVEDPTAPLHNVMPETEIKRTGYTEWQAFWQGRALSLGWDWVTHRDGGIQRSDTVPPRSNLRLVDACGYDFGLDDELPGLCARIDSLRWQSIALQAIEMK